MVVLISPDLLQTEYSVRRHLRTATNDLHSDLDARLAPLITQGDTGYAKFLSCSAAALLPIERALGEAGIAAVLPDWPQRSRSEALRLDLSDLSLPEPSSPPSAKIGGRAFQLGMVYVLEGSRLGARLLLREAQFTLGPAARAAMRYLSHGQGLPLWQTFLQRLEASPDVCREPEHAAAGARAAFQLFLTAADLYLPSSVVPSRG